MNYLVSFLVVPISLLASIYVNGAATHEDEDEDEDVPLHHNYATLWGGDHIKVLHQSTEIQLTLDNYSGSGFQSLQKYGSGWFSMRIKMPQKDSTAAITTFYLQSDAEHHRDEIDFEFLGGNSGNKEQPYLLHTNIYTNGQGGREQRIYLLFDPSADFHNYTLLWNHKQIVLFVDDIPIRVLKNTTENGGGYPAQAMRIIGTIWTHTWASNGKPVNWNDAPFEAHYRGFQINACQTHNASDQQCHSSKYWWNHKKYWTLDSVQQQAYNKVRNMYMNYDYCSVTKSPECP